MLADEKIIELFFARSEQAIAALGTKYGKLCYKLAHNILGDRRDAEECVNDAYLGVWNAIPPARPEMLSAFLCRIVRNTSLKCYEKKRAAKRDSTYDIAMEELAGCLSAPETVENAAEANELAHIIEAFLDTLPEENRVIFLRRYWFADSYAAIAARVRLSEKTVSVRLTRMRQQLREYLQKEGVLP